RDAKIKAEITASTIRPIRKYLVVMEFNLIGNLYHTIRLPATQDKGQSPPLEKGAKGGFLNLFRKSPLTPLLQRGVIHCHCFLTFWDRRDACPTCI
ncbi:MAG TPA: hypothetical protein DEP99_03065, partial [Nitrospiraceae bacterium]|nr:hypothetical protein [Nitrospiraceae bacterium]